MSANGKKIAAAAVSGLMAVGTLPVAAIAETAQATSVETQAGSDYKNVVSTQTLSFTYHGHDYTQKDGDTIKLRGDAYDSHDHKVVLKSVGSLTFQETGENAYDVYSGTDKVGQANTYATSGAIVVNYTFDATSDSNPGTGTVSYSASTVIGLDTTDAQDYSELTLEKIDAAGNKVTTLGNPTYNGQAQTLKLFDEGVEPKYGYTVDSIESQPSTGSAAISADQQTVTVTNAGTYTFHVTYNGQSYDVTIKVDKLDLASANVVALDYAKGAHLGVADLVINGEAGTDFKDASGNSILKVEQATGTTITSDSKSYTVSIADGYKDNPNVVDSSATVTANEVDALETVTYGSTAYTTGLYDLGTADIDNVDANFDPDELDDKSSGSHDVNVTYYDLDNKANVTEDYALNNAGHFLAIAQVDRGASNTRGGTVIFKFTNVKLDQVRVQVKFGGKMVAAGTTGVAEYTGSSLKPEVTVYDSDDDVVDPSKYTVTIEKTNSQGGNRTTVDDIVDAGYYRVVVRMNDGSAIHNGNSVTDLIVTPVQLVAQVSDEGQVYDDSTDKLSDSHFTYTGSSITPTFEFFKQDDSGDYALYNSRIYKYSDLTEAAKASLNKSARYSKVDVASDAYTVKFFNGGDATDSVTDKGTYSYTVYDAKPGLEDNYWFVTTGDTFRVSDERVFDDVANDAWYAQVVNDAHAKGYINGYSGGKLFGPENSITRADVACILFNVAKESLNINPSADWYDTQNGYNTGFSDVDGHQYYAQAIAWAKNAGVVNGYGDGTFKPEQNVTREEFAAMLANYAKLVRNYEAGSESDLSSFPDASSVSDWAKDVVAWAVHNKVMGNGGFINPQGNITRAETAAMVMNFDAIKR